MRVKFTTVWHIFSIMKNKVELASGRQDTMDTYFMKSCLSFSLTNSPRARTCFCSFGNETYSCTSWGLYTMFEVLHEAFQKAEYMWEVKCELGDSNKILIEGLHALVILFLTDMIFRQYSLFWVI